MPYMLLIVEPTNQRSERTVEAGRALYDRMLSFGNQLKERGLLIASESLASTNEAVRVQSRNSSRRLVDGPFAESKEMIGGFFLLNCDTRDEAVEIAAMCPAAEWCTIEVRRIAPCYQ
jgi:hypothetical protein